VKVIASSVRKGNILEVDGQLYVVLSAESFFPGKGTPTTQIDMRRLSDGTKTTQRYKTTEQVERAFVEDREHTFLYEDGEGFHFMNPETYDQVVASPDMIGEDKMYLSEGMTVVLSIHEGNPIAMQLPRHVVLAVARTGDSYRVYEPGAGRVLGVTRATLRSPSGPVAALGHWGHLAWALLPVPRRG